MTLPDGKGVGEEAGKQLILPISLQQSPKL